MAIFSARREGNDDDDDDVLSTVENPLWLGFKWTPETKGRTISRPQPLKLLKWKEKNIEKNLRFRFFNF